MQSARARLQPVFAASAFWTTTLHDGRLRREPSGQVHGKTLGTTTTLCGKSTLSWSMFWHINFASVQHDRCPQCAYALRDGNSTG